MNHDKDGMLLNNIVQFAYNAGCLSQENNESTNDFFERVAEFVWDASQRYRRKNVAPENLALGVSRQLVLDLQSLRSRLSVLETHAVEGSSNGLVDLLDVRTKNMLDRIEALESLVDPGARDETSV